jgi:hypothetical protein
MAAEDMIAALPQYWDDVGVQLGPDATRELTALIGQLGGPGHNRVVDLITDILIEGLPARHPVRRKLAGGDLSATATIDWAEIVSSLRAETGASRAGLAEPPWAAGGPVLAEVTRRLLTAPALGEADVRRRGVDPADPALICLQRDDGSRQWPQFQFARDGGMLPVVRAVNEVLQAGSDPIGTADWWLSRNGWLGERPAELIGRVPDVMLVDAARAVGSEALRAAVRAAVSVRRNPERLPAQAGNVPVAGARAGARGERLQARARGPALRRRAVRRHPGGPLPVLLRGPWGVHRDRRDAAARPAPGRARHPGDLTRR